MTVMESQRFFDTTEGKRTSFDELRFLRETEMGTWFSDFLPGDTSLRVWYFPDRLICWRMSNTKASIFCNVSFGLCDPKDKIGNFHCQCLDGW
jgi:hypothetical protein